MARKNKNNKKARERSKIDFTPRGARTSMAAIEVTSIHHCAKSDFDRRGMK
jgi:hypothetical protein